jgi:hypothetical protein
MTRYFKNRLRRRNSATKVGQPSFFNKDLDTHPFFDGTQLASVNLHHSSEAQKVTDALHAKAVTLGNDVYISPKHWQPQQKEGQHLLAHELAHVAQNQKQTSQAHTAYRAISTPLPDDVAPDKKTKIAKFNIDDVKVIIYPDQLKGKTVLPWSNPKKKEKAIVHDNRAQTVFYLKSKMTVNYEKVKGVTMIVKIDMAYELHIVTIYGKNVGPDSVSGYGRGTTEEDKKEGNTSLKFHEGAHGTHLLNYIKNNPLPVIDVRLPCSQADYKEAVQIFNTDFEAYMNKMSEHNVNEVDNVGHSMDDYESHQHTHKD